TIGSTDSYCVDFTSPANPNTTTVAKWGLQSSAGTCATGPTTTTTTTSSTTTTTQGSCGDGAVNAPGEECDDGNLVDCDGCDSNCTLSSTCGNNITCAPEQCDGGPNCNSSCESTASSCNPILGQRLVIVSLNTPEPLAGVQVNLTYPGFQTSIPGSGNTSSVGSHLFLFPTQGVNIFNDQDGDINTVFANTTNFLSSGPLFAANFD